MRLSFLVAACDEELFLPRCLASLAAIRAFHPDTEILVGLDGCTDRSEAIARGFSGVVIEVFSPRGGKHAVVNRLLERATGEIAVVHDADLEFVAGPEDLRRLEEVFSDPRVGGLADHASVTWHPEKIRRVDQALYLGDAWHSLLFLEYKTRLFAREEGGRRFLEGAGLPPLFFVNIFRRSLVTPQQTLCDDGERALQILRKGYRLALLSLETPPYQKTLAVRFDCRSTLRARFRGLLASRQLEEAYGIGALPAAPRLTGYCGYVLRNLPRLRRPRAWLGLGLVAALYLLAAARLGLWKLRHAGKTPISSVEGWALRMRRHA